VLSFCVLFALDLVVVRVTFMPCFDNVKRTTMMVVKVVLVSFFPFEDVQRCVDRFAIFSALQQMQQIIFWVSHGLIGGVVRGGPAYVVWVFPFSVVGNVGVLLWWMWWILHGRWTG
jgi:hypothetical protein